MARVDHWFKNAFMLPGVILALFYRPELFAWASVPPLALAVLATCLIASSNYVLNELLDSRRDAFHPFKRHRPGPSGRVRPAIGYLEWLALGATGIGLSMLISRYVALAGMALWVMGLVYNVPPVRTKEWPYLDVLSEAANSPIRLFLGWFALVGDLIPPVSLTLSYWMAGAFLMGAKRLAEYRQIGDPSVAAAYRRSFGYYTEVRLLVSLFFYSSTSALLMGVFIVRYHVELVLFAPVGAAILAYGLKVTLQPNSPMADPEALYKERRFLTFAILGAAILIALMFVHVPVLYDWFNIEPSAMDRVEPLWTIPPREP